MITLERIILRCPVCQFKGEKQNLAEVLADGGLRIIRSEGFNNRSYTEIRGNDLTVSCGNCNTVVYYKRPKVEATKLTGDYVVTQTFQFFGTFL